MWGADPRLSRARPPAHALQRPAAGVDVAGPLSPDAADACMYACNACTRAAGGLPRGAGRYACARGWAWRKTT
eukprot:1907043-Ditylum_brightwellii.AAC.1